MIQCGNCQQEIRDDHKKSVSDRIPCPNCGSRSRLHQRILPAQVEAKVRLKASHTRPGIKRPILEISQGDDFHRNTGVWNYLIRILDRGNNWYSELITNKKTGKIVKQSSEKLTDHVGHGDAKTKLISK